jgi:EAL domain-containing protein (putative c-di-GMP-specific phosphodiesterase class I)
LHQLSSLGVQLVIDDFGSGYSWLSHLKYLSNSKLKIGQDFIRSSTTHSKEREIVAAMLTIAKQVGTVVVAEGVETSAQLEFLKKHQCHEAQGYFFYPPLPVEDLTRLLQTGIE